MLSFKAPQYRFFLFYFFPDITTAECAKLRIAIIFFSAFLAKHIFHLLFLSHNLTLFLCDINILTLIILIINI